MDQDKEHRIRTRAYQIWEDEGRPHDRHHDHWQRAERESDPDGDGRSSGSGSAHPGMMGDGTEEQDLGQPGQPDARVTRDEVEDAFKRN